MRWHFVLRLFCTTFSFPAFSETFFPLTFLHRFDSIHLSYLKTLPFRDKSIKKQQNKKCYRLVQHIHAIFLNLCEMSVQMNAVGKVLFIVLYHWMKSLVWISETSKNHRNQNKICLNDKKNVETFGKFGHRRKLQIRFARKVRSLFCF